MAQQLPRLERERCVFKPPRSDRLECYVLIVPENREKPSGREVRLKLVVLKAKRKIDPDPMVYLAGGPGDSPLVASNVGADPLSEGDWWNDTANIRKRRDVIILSQRGAGGSTPNLDCFDSRNSEAARLRRRAITESQERDILIRCRAEFDRKSRVVSSSLSGRTGDRHQRRHCISVGAQGENGGAIFDHGSGGIVLLRAA